MCPEVKPTLADRAVPTQTFPAVNLLDRSMNPDPEHVEGQQQIAQLVRPALLFDDVLH